jgi:hypothetical protein
LLYRNSVLIFVLVLYLYQVLYLYCDVFHILALYYGGYKKGKVVPLRPIEALLGDRRYSSYSFLTSALEGGEWSASRPATL